jgi:ABC-type transport system involved in cytochrome c biogenesis permease subunit
MPFLLLLGYWMLAVSAEPMRLPATYDSPWLWVHVGVGKVFLGSCLIGASLSVVLLMHDGRGDRSSQRLVADTVRAEGLMWRCMSLAFVFHSLMLVAGAVWAQDAWGRYWAWDPLETWAFVTWLVLGLTLHLRLTYALPTWVGRVLNIFVFVLAFLTFFGVPFLSIAPHKGVM